MTPLATAVASVKKFKQSQGLSVWTHGVMHVSCYSIQSVSLCELTSILKLLETIGGNGAEDTSARMSDWQQGG